MNPRTSPLNHPLAASSNQHGGRLASFRTSVFIALLVTGDLRSEPAGTQAANPGATSKESGGVSPQGFVTLFNGKDLDGWTTRQPGHHDWSVVDGVIDCNPQGDAPGDRNLWTRQEYGDFELWMDWRIKENPFVNRKARLILPDGTFKKDETGNATPAVPTTSRRSSTL